MNEMGRRRISKNKFLDSFLRSISNLEGNNLSDNQSLPLEPVRIRISTASYTF